MNTQTPPQKEARLQIWYNETIIWAKEFDLYIDELNELKRRVSSKKVKDHIEAQVKKNIDLITNTTQDRLMKNLSDNLKKHKSELSNKLENGNLIDIQTYQENHKSLAKETKKLKGKIKSLKTRISDFLNPVPHVQRHGFSY